jgi:AraC-like DNA-binding protein
MYSERASAVGPAVAWRSSAPGRTRVLPDGCMDLLWLGGQLVVAGPDSTAYLTTSPPGGAVGLRFASGLMPALLGVPAAELRNRRVDLADLRPAAEVRRLSDQVGAAEDPLVALESLVSPMVRSATPDPLMREIARLLHVGSPVRRTAERVGLSERQLHRRSLVAYGYGPKTLARILRLNRALALARRGVDYAACAQRAGYVDQAHLARDVRSLAGTTLSELVR